MDEQYQVAGSHTELESVRFLIGCPVLQRVDVLTQEALSV